MAFVDEYLQCFNATEAYDRVYHPKRRATSRANGSKLLANTDISDEIQARLQEKHMSADEALTLLADIARGDMSDFMDEGTLMLDMRKAKAAGKTRLIKKLKQRTVTKLGKNESDDDMEIHDLEVELYPADAALRDVLKVTGQYKDLGSEDNPYVVHVKKIGVDIDKV